MVVAGAGGHAGTPVSHTSLGGGTTLGPVSASEGHRPCFSQTESF